MNARTLLGTVLRLLGVALAVSLLSLFVMYVWPTPYRYDHMTVDGEVVVVRIDRITGAADMLVADEGWVPVEGEDATTPNGPDKL